MKNYVIVLIAILVLGVAGSAFGQKNSDAALTALVQEMANAQVAFDQAALDRILTADYIEISPAGEFDPREKVLGFYKPELKPAVVPQLVVSDLSIRNYGKFAIVIAKLSYLVPNAPPATARSMRATFVCRNEKTGWKIASAQYTGIRPATAPK